ncbi:hypothetical protein DSECCO2_562250 [anaerobic digester metagenome]
MPAPPHRTSSNSRSSPARSVISPRSQVSATSRGTSPTARRGTPVTPRASSEQVRVRIASSPGGSSQSSPARPRLSVWARELETGRPPKRPSHGTSRPAGGSTRPASPSSKTGTTSPTNLKGFRHGSVASTTSSYPTSEPGSPNALHLTRMDLGLSRLPVNGCRRFSPLGKDRSSSSSSTPSGSIWASDWPNF